MVRINMSFSVWERNSWTGARPGRGGGNLSTSWGGGMSECGGEFRPLASSIIRLYSPHTRDCADLRDRARRAVAVDAYH